MSSQILLEEFERIGDAPSAVSLLRKFVLDLAVRGVLLPQDSHDEDVKFLLERLSAEGANKSAERRGSSRSTFVIEVETLPFTIPDSWGWVHITEVCDVRYGFAFDSARFCAPGTGRPLIRIRDISSFDTQAYYDGDFDASYLVQAGDFLVGMDGDFNVREWKGPPALLNQRVMRLSGWRQRISPGWVTIPLQMILNHLHASTSLTTVKHLSAKQMNAVRIPLPPLAEQQRIVSKVNQFMSLCDELETEQKEREINRDALRSVSLRRLTSTDNDANRNSDVQKFLKMSSRLMTKPEHVAAVRQSILDLAVSGYLAEQGPERWREIELGDLLAEGSRNGYSRKPDEAEGGIPILKISSGTVRRDGVIEETEHRKISAVSPQDRDLLALRNGDLLACRFNGNRDSVGVLTLFVDYLGIAPIYPDKLIRLRVDRSQVTSELLRWWSRTSLIRARTDKYKATTVGNWGISAGNLKKVIYPVPSLMEQHRIVEKIDELMAVCDELETSLVSVQRDRARFLAALLQDALDRTLRSTAMAGQVHQTP